jgi:hypothetical protein
LKLSLHTSTSPATEEIKKESTSGPYTSSEEMNSENQVKYGVNTPRSAGEFASEVGHAAKGVADSAKDTLKVTATVIKRSLGMSNEKPLSQPEIHGGAGKMQHAPPQVGKDLGEGGPAKSRAHAEAKYQEIMKTEKPHFPHGEESINEMFPDMREAAKLQNQGGRERNMENVGGQLGVAGEEGKSREFENDPERRQMDKTMHDLGP